MRHKNGFPLAEARLIMSRAIIADSFTPEPLYNCLVRIIAGQYRSRRLRSLRGMDTRPTSDRLRETLFNVLSGGRLEAMAGGVWFDLYAGTGAVGLEALSRGASQVYFIEAARPSAAVIRENLRSLGITGGFELIEKKVAPALRGLECAAVACDVCFLDPPYRDTGAYSEVLGLLAQSRLLRPASVVIAEHDKHFDPGSHFGALERYRLLNQGDSGLSFYRVVP